MHKEQTNDQKDPSLFDPIELLLYCATAGPSKVSAHGSEASGIEVA